MTKKQLEDLVHGEYTVYLKGEVVCLTIVHYSTPPKKIYILSNESVRCTMNFKTAGFSLRFYIGNVVTESKCFKYKEIEFPEKVQSHELIPIKLSQNENLTSPTI